MKIVVDRAYLETLKDKLLNHDYVTFKNKAMVSFMNGQFSHSKNFYTHSVANQIRTQYREILDAYTDLGVWLVSYDKDFRFIEKTIANGYPVGTYANSLLQEKVKTLSSLSSFPDLEMVSYFDSNRNPRITYSTKRNAYYVPNLKIGESLLVDGAIGVGYRNYKDALKKERTIPQVNLKQRKISGLLDVDPYGNVFHYFTEAGVSLERVVKEKTAILLVGIADSKGNLVAWMQLNDFISSYQHGDPFALDLPKLRETDSPDQGNPLVTSVDSETGGYSLLSFHCKGFHASDVYPLTGAKIVSIKR